jgi:hypothetical protein
MIAGLDPIATPILGLGTALGLGIAFGWFLEQGGLGEARKLAGQFYLTDLTVLKVMFSGILTAMLGLFWLGRLGLIDPSRLFVPPTFVWPQVVGGLLFGVGFATSGLCPGTSCVAAASRRAGGLAVVGGLLGGVGLFTLLFRWVEPFYTSSSRGALTVPAAIGVPEGVVVFAVVLAALGAFRGAEWIERRHRGPAAE